MDGTQDSDVSPWGIIVPVTETGKLQVEEWEKETNSVLNMLSLLSLVWEIPKKRCREGFGYIHLELSGEIWAGDTYLVVINIKMGIKPSMGVDENCLRLVCSARR